MTDEELIKRLRSLSVIARHAAADRIEQLLEGNKGLAEAFATVSVKREMAEAKLAKAVEALRIIAEKPIWGQDMIQWIGNVTILAVDTLAELEKTE